MIGISAKLMFTLKLGKYIELIGIIDTSSSEIICLSENYIKKLGILTTRQTLLIG